MYRFIPLFITALTIFINDSVISQPLWNGRIDAATYDSDQKCYYLFNGNEYARHDFAKAGSAKFPRKLLGNWSGWPASWGNDPVDAVVYDSKKGVYYLFHKNEYVKHAFGESSGPPKPITRWSGWPASWGSGNVDAVVYDSDKDVYYLFKNGHYVKHKWGQASGAPKPITNWSGWPGGQNQLNAMAYDSERKVYFIFHESDGNYFYTRHIWGQPKEAGYPKGTFYSWVGYPKTLLEGTYLFEHWLSGRALTGSDDGQSYHLSSKTGKSNQVFRVKYLGGGAYEFISQATGRRNYALKSMHSTTVSLDSKDEPSVKLSQHSYGFGYYYISDKEHPKETEAEKFEALCFPCYDMSNNIPPTSSQNTSSGNALSLFPETYTSVALPRFSMIISSDPQFFWSPYYEKENNYNKSQKQERAIKTFDHFAQSVNAHNQMLNNRIKGVIINGDITRNGNWPHFAQIDRSFSKVKLPLYWGLGNHDVQNPAEAYKWMYNKLIPNHGVQVDLEKSLTNFNWDGTDSDQYDQISSYSGSLSYTWTESGVRFIQLQFHPEYEILPGILSPKWIENNVRYDLKVKNSITWLSSVLMVARLKGEKVIINMHVPPADRHIEKEFGQIVRTFQNEILAIFAGHLHYNDCRLPDFNSVPVFVSGAIFNNNYYLLSFYDNAFGVNKCYSANGKVNISGERWIIPY